MKERTLIEKKFAELFDKNIPLVPIPFFGNISSAKIITIGANPSSTELKRNFWSEKISSNKILDRLLNYFDYSPHEWFDTYEQGLMKIGYSYHDGTAAHIDLCPWATYSLRNIENKKMTNKVIELFKQSKYSFQELMINHISANFTLMAGSVTKKYYIDKFVTDFVNKDKIELINKNQIKTDSPFVSNYIFKINGKCLKTLFISASPSYKKCKNSLIELIEENKEFLT
nr:hypothetical protein [uncultured Treponema sp.]